MPKGEKFPEGHGKIDMKFREGQLKKKQQYPKQDYNFLLENNNQIK